MRKRVLVAGATGYLGRHLLDELTRRDYWVRALTRSTQKAVDLRIQVDDWFVGEVSDPESIATACEGVDIVFSSLGVTRQKEGFSHQDVDYRGNLNLLANAVRHGVKKFVYISVLDAAEMSHLKLVQAKERFVEALRESGLNHLVVRPNGYFSDLRAFLDMARKGRVFLFGDGGFRINPIHGRDLARFCAEALEGTATELSVGGPVVHTHQEIAEAAFAVLGKPPKITKLPVALGKLLLLPLRALTPERVHGPIEFTVTTLTRDMIGPKYGNQTLPRFFAEEAGDESFSGLGAAG